MDVRQLCHSQQSSLSAQVWIGLQLYGDSLPPTRRSAQTSSYSEVEGVTCATSWLLNMKNSMELLGNH